MGNCYRGRKEYWRKDGEKSVGGVWEKDERDAEAGKGVWLSGCVAGRLVKVVLCLFVWLSRSLLHVCSRKVVI